MDDSDQDFVDLCSKLLKRVRRKDGETVSQDPTKDVPTAKRQVIRRKNNAGNTFKVPPGRSVKTQPVSPTSSAACDQPNLVPSNPDKSKPAVVNGVTEVGDGEKPGRAKDKVLQKMQQFKRVNPQKLVHGVRNPLSETENISATLPQCPEPSTSTLPHSPGSASTPVPLDPQAEDSDEALALRLQEELDREAHGEVVDLGQGGLFFCQLCQRDISSLSPAGRTQHINRCLDESEDSSSSRAPPAPPHVPECPICGRRFKSQKSRAAHLKRCSSSMGVAPAVLLQAVQRQAAEGLTDDTANQPPQVGGSKRKGPADPSHPARKKPRRKPRGLDEDTMVALALSRSLLEQEKERERATQREIEGGGGQRPPAVLPHLSLSPLKWRAETSKGRGKRRKGAAPRPPPLLLVQDPEVALRHLQERVTTLLLCPRAPSPLTPTRCPSSLTSRGGDALLWQMSALPGGGSKVVSEFYTPELRDIIVPWVSGEPDAVTPSKAKPDPSDSQASVRDGTPLSVEKQPPSTQRPGNLTVGSQTLCDLMELAEEGMTLTQWGYSATGPDLGNSDVRLNDFVPERSTDDHLDLCLSGFIPERRVPVDPGRSASQHVATNQKSVALSRLTADLSSMVNNPQLSDVQLQVDSGEVYFAHSFMLYARCPLLAQMVHDSGFGVQEEGVPPAQRVLLGDVAGQAVWSLLQYLYTASCPPLSRPLIPHLRELAVRFDLVELRQLCQLHPGQTVTQGEQEGEPGVDNPGLERQTAGKEEVQQDKVLVELLRSLWNEDENEEEEGRAEGGEEVWKGEAGHGVMLEEGETSEERVNEDEMEEIYEFAASQRKRDEGKEQLVESGQAGPIGGHTLAVEEQVIPLKALSLAERPFSTEETQTTTNQRLVTRETEVNQSEGTKPEHTGIAVLRKGRRSEPDFAGLGEVPDGCPHPSPEGALDQKASLERSYNRLFSDSWGVYETQADPWASSPSPARASPKRTHSQPPRTKAEGVIARPNPTHPPPSRSRPSEVRVDPVALTLQSPTRKSATLSIGPPGVPGVSTLPVCDWSPGEVTDPGGRGRTGGGAVGVAVPVRKALFRERTRLSQGDCKADRWGPYSGPDSLSPPHSSQQPELIVLSDSSEEMETGDPAPDRSPSTSLTPHPCPPQNQPKYTRIRAGSNSKPTTEPDTPTSRTQSDPDPGRSCLKEEETGPGSVGVPPGSASSPGSASPDQSLMDYSAEMSWLIPATPPMVSKSTTSSSTQTHSSMRRTQLFPKNNLSVSSTSFLSSPALLSKPSLPTSHTSSLPNPAQAESSVSRLRSNNGGPQRSRLGLDQGDGSFRRCRSDPAVEPTDHSAGFVIPPSQMKRSQLPGLIPDAPQPYSSTPLPAHLPKPPALSSASMASPLLRESCGGSAARRRGRKGEESQSPGKRGDHTSSPPRVAPSQPTESSGSPGRHGPSAESECFHSPGDGEMEVNGETESRVTGRPDKPMEMEELENSVAKEEETDKRVEPEEESFLGMEEPAMAFDDSWGLNGGGDVSVEPSQRVCFSLRLESSDGGGSPPGQTRGGQEVPSSAFASSSPPKTHTTRSCTTPSPPPPTTPQSHPEINASLLDNPEMWEDWAEEALPLPQRVDEVALARRVAQLKTPVVSRQRGQQCPLVPITPMPSYSDMDTPELKNKLNRFGVRPLPKRQMILKLKEIHQYTHQVVSSESEDEAPSVGRPQLVGPLSTGGDPSRPVSCALTVPATVSPGGDEGLPASQGSSTSSTAPSEDSERSNPERCPSDDDSSDSDTTVTASQAVSSLQERLVAVRRFIQSDPRLYGQILQYQPLVLADLQVRLKAAGIRLGAAKLLDYLDSQCITFTTAKPRGEGGRRGRGGGSRGLQGRTRGRGRRGRRGAAHVLD